MGEAPGHETALEDSAGTGAIVLLTPLARAISRRSTDDLLGISLIQLALLAYLRDHPVPSQQVVSEVLCLDANNCVRFLNELESLGYAERHRDPSDRRRHLISITASGRVALEHAERAQQSIEDDVLGTLNPDERQALRRLLRQALAEPTPDLAVVAS